MTKYFSQKSTKTKKNDQHDEETEESMRISPFLVPRKIRISNHFTQRRQAARVSSTLADEKYNIPNTDDSSCGSTSRCIDWFPHHVRIAVFVRIFVRSSKRECLTDDIYCYFSFHPTWWIFRIRQFKRIQMKYFANKAEHSMALKQAAHNGGSTLRHRVS